MNRVLACCVFALVCFTGAIADPRYGSYPSYHELAKFEEALHRTASEKRFLREKADMLKSEKFKLDEFVENAVLPQVIDLSDVFGNQDNRIRTIKFRVKNLLERLGDLEARVAGNAAAAKRNQDDVNPRWSRIDGLSGSNALQSADLARIEATLSDSVQKLVVKLIIPVLERRDAVHAVSDDAERYTEIINSRKCFVEYVHVEIDPEIAEGTADVAFPPHMATENNIPTAFCGIQGIISKLDDKHSKGYGGYGYPDELQNLAVTVDCKPTENNVTVTVFDQSRGEGNKIITTYVEVKACYFAALSGF